MTVKLYHGDCLQVLGRLEAESVHCVVTSPPYWGLRDYGVHGQLGLEATVEEHVERMVEVFRAVRRVMRKDATLWMNYGDSYAGAPPGNDQPDHSGDRKLGTRGVQGASRRMQRTSPRGPCRGLKPKDLVGMPWMVAFALQADGWWLRSDIIYAKSNPMPESVTDRPTRSHEHLFLLAKSATYHYDADAVRGPHAEKTLTHRGQGSCGKASSQDSLGKVASGSWSKTVRIVDPRGRNLRDVWTIPTEPFTGWAETSRRVRVASGDADGDTTRITSPDCPVHGLMGRPSPILVCDGREGDASIRTGCTDGDHDQEPPADSAPTDQRHDENCAGRSSDLPRLGSSPSATGRSSENRRTVPALETTPPCTSVDETLSHTADTSGIPESRERTSRKRASNTSPDATDDPPSEETTSHSEGTASVYAQAFEPPSCTCEYYREITEKTSHFATFPTKLVEPCIKAGTSEHGCCATCGAPWVRQVERKSFGKAASRTKFDSTLQGGPLSRSRQAYRANGMEGPPPPIHLGWSPGCACAAPVVPCTVLDPFGGAGTVGLVADRLGRNAVLIELNPEYLELARSRIVNDAPLFAQVEVIR